MFDQLKLQEYALALKAQVLGWLSSPAFYVQVAAIIVAYVAARIAARHILTRVPLFLEAPKEGRLVKLRAVVFSSRDLLRPFLVFAFLTVAATSCEASVGTGWLVRLAQSAAIISLLYSVINRFLHHPLLNAAARWIGIPVATLYVFGYIPQVIAFLDNAAFSAGNVRVSLLSMIKAVIFGGLLFWAGRLSSNTGQRVIRQQESIDVQTRELAAKGFDIAVIGTAILLLMNLLGMDLSILAVFSGAVGVGLGFGLQQIASNFISGIIILLERSLKLGDFIELEDGKSGTLTALNMRSSTLATYDGKEIMVPNEKFITTRFINWTHSDPRQRYEVPFSLPYGTDIRKVPALIEKAILNCSGVLPEPEKPECAFKSFGENNINFSAKFWANGIDDGKNSFTSEVGFAIWEALDAAGVAMRMVPREVHVIEEPQARKPKS
jgi:small-conductance mechanosensitive channel